MSSETNSSEEREFVLVIGNKAKKDKTERKNSTKEWFKWTLYCQCGFDVIQEVKVELPSTYGKNRMKTLDRYPFRFSMSAYGTDTFPIVVTTCDENDHRFEHELIFNPKKEKFRSYIINVVVNPRTQLLSPKDFLPIKPWIRQPIYPQREDFVSTEGWGLYAGRYNGSELRVAFYCPKFKSSREESFICFSKHTKSHFYIQTVFPEHVQRGDLKKHFDAVYFPGGYGPNQCEYLGEEGRRELCEFISEGGGYVGICAGAYVPLTSRKKGKDWVLSLMNVKYETTEPPMRGKDYSTKVEFTERGNSELLKLSNNRRLRIYKYSNGPMMEIIPGDSPEYKQDLGKPVVFAHFRSGVAKNSKFTVEHMVGTPAIVGADYFKGRILGCSPHPERRESEEVGYLIRNFFRWVCRRRVRTKSGSYEETYISDSDDDEDEGEI